MILWSDKQQYTAEPFELEKDLEKAILQVAPTLFGASRIYIDTKKKIGARGKKKNQVSNIKDFGGRDGSSI